MTYKWLFVLIMIPMVIAQYADEEGFEVSGDGYLTDDTESYRDGANLDQWDEYDRSQRGREMTDDEDFATSGDGDVVEDLPEMTETPYKQTYTTDKYETETIEEIIEDVVIEEIDLLENTHNDKNTKMNENDETQQKTTQAPNGLRESSDVLVTEEEEEAWYEAKHLIAALISGCAAGVLFATLLIILCIHRIRKKDEGSYEIMETKYHHGQRTTSSEKHEAYA